jgi:putative membrane protein
MIIRGGTTVWRALQEDWSTLVFLLMVSIGAELLNIYAPFPMEQTALPILPLGMLITAMSIFLGFQINQSYDRWWEARKLWGRLVNSSRDFGRQVTTLMTGVRVGTMADPIMGAVLRQQIIYRHMAYVHALRMCLRGEGRIDHEDWLFLRSYLTDNDMQVLKAARNVPTQILQIQARELGKLFAANIQEQQIQLALEAHLVQFSDIQGGCERIKRQAFPDRFAYHTRGFVWMLALVLPFNLFYELKDFDLVAVFTETLLSFIFVTIERLGRELRDPFENRENDTPMSALSRNIEIDLRQQLGETHIPPALHPVHGILM